MYQSIQIPSPIGQITITTSQKGIFGIQFLDAENKQGLSTDPLTMAQIQLQEYFNGHRKAFTVPLDLTGIRGFQKDVLEVVSSVAFGEVLTYRQVAILLNNPNASRAVGAALARNPLPILIPCHRVVAANGHLTGYLGQKGIAPKKWLLELEGHKIVGEKLG